MTAPIRARARVGSRRTSMPKSEARPRDGRIRLVMILMVVDLPAPFGPRKPRDVPCATVRSRALSAVKWSIACDRLFDGGFHRIAIYRDILKSLVKIQGRIRPHAFRARPVRRVAGALKPREKVSH